MEIMDTAAAITVTAGADMDMAMDMDMALTLGITMRNRMEQRNISGKWRQRYFFFLYSNPSLDISL